MGDRKGLLWNHLPKLHQKFLKTSKEFEHELLETLIESSFLHITTSAHPLDVRFEIIREKSPVDYRIG